MQCAERSNIFNKKEIHVDKNTAKKMFKEVLKGVIFTRGRCSKTRKNLTKKKYLTAKILIT